MPQEQQEPCRGRTTQDPETSREKNIKNRVVESDDACFDESLVEATLEETELSDIDERQSAEERILSQLARMPSKCHVCQHLVHIFTHPDDYGEDGMYLGTFDEVASTECEWHKPLVEHFIQYVRQQSSWTSERITLGRSWGMPELWTTLYISGTYINEDSDEDTDGYDYYSLNYALLNSSPSSPNWIAKGCIIDPTYVDLDAIKYRKSQCLSNHGVKCQNPMKITPTRPSWLIDVRRRCVVPGNGIHADASFVALSYHWGSDAGVNVTREVMAELQEPGVLNEGGYLASRLVTPTVWHAIHFTKALDEQYLWVDALCIVHGGEDTAEQLNLMGAIYASAIVTIIAADGCAQDGIAGLNQVPGSGSGEKYRRQVLIPFGSDNTIIVHDPWSLFLRRKAYSSRAWTFQEYVLASRKVIFTSGLAHWKCQCSEWHEDLVLAQDTNNYILPESRGILAGLPDLNFLDLTLSDYNTRFLRYDEDALPGIMGLLSIYSRLFSGGFLYGLPEMFFDRALGWISSEVERRKRSDRLENQVLSTSKLPSWSWIGWRGSIQIGQEAIWLQTSTEFITETFPITYWATGPTPTTPPSIRRQINSAWYKHRNRWKMNAANLAGLLPAGWTRDNVLPTVHERYIWPDGCSRYTYKYNGLNGVLSPNYENAFFYPFPVSEVTETTPPDMPLQTPYLFCTTQKGHFWTHGAKFGCGGFLALLEFEPLNTILHNESGIVVGNLYLHSHTQLRELQNASKGTQLGTRIELVAINLIRRYAKTLDIYNEWVLPVWVEDAYTVLWVEWEGGIAYRKAVGLVEKDKWEALNLQEVELVLG